MAFARFGRDSDVYVYEDMQGGFTCERCPCIGQSYRCAKAREMVAHLIGFHRARGDRVPDETIVNLEREDSGKG